MSPSASPAVVKPYHALMSLVFTVALGAAWTMLPGDNELIAMLERDGHSRDALAILEDDYQNGDRRYRTLHQMLALYENEGNTAKARIILEDMIRQRPRDPALNDRLVKFYRAIGDGEAHLGALKAQIEARYNETACRDYIALIRLKGGADDEMAAIQLCRAKGYRRPNDLARLAELAAASGDKAQAAGILRAIDDVKRLKSSDERLLLVSMLLDQGQPKEVERRAVRWIKASKDRSAALLLVDVLARSKYPETALEVAKDAGEAGDSLSLTVGERLLERSQPQVARLYLRGWLENAAFENEEVATRFVAAAIEAADPHTALLGARKYGIGKLPVGVARELARTLANGGLKAEAAEVLAANAEIAEGLTYQPEDATASSAKLPGGAPAAGVDEPAPGGAPGGSVKRPVTIRPEAVNLRTDDPLASWRRGLTARMSEDAQRKVAALGHPLPRGPAGQGLSPGFDSKTHVTHRVLKKTGRVLQRTKRLKSLKLRQKLVRERAGKRNKT